MSNNTTKATLTEAEIDSMEAGPGMDAQVALQVIGLTLTLDANRGEWESTIAPYSTDIAAAWEAAIQCGLFAHLHNRQWLTFDSTKGVWQIGDDGEWDKPAIHTEAPTLPLVLCRAALKTTL